MFEANESPLTLGQIIDRIEQMREEMLMLQRSLEKIELAESRAPADGDHMGSKDV